MPIANRPTAFFAEWARAMEDVIRGPGGPATKQGRIDHLQKLLELMYRLGYRDAADVLEATAAYMASDDAMTQLEQLWRQAEGDGLKPDSKFISDGRP